MATNAPENVTHFSVDLAHFDLYSDQHVTNLAGLYEQYLFEEYERLSQFPAGIPIADWLMTVILYVNGEPVGFSSSDRTRCAVELIYIAPAWRSLGIAKQHLEHLRATCPGELRIKAPLSPGGEALAQRLNIPVSRPDRQETAESRRSIEALHRSISATCPHPRKGNPSQPCPRCYRVALKRAVVRLVIEPCTVVRAVNDLLGAA